MIGLLGRLVFGFVLSICIGIIGNIAGWYTAYSVPRDFVYVPFMPVLTGLGAGVGGFLAWRIDFDGKPKVPIFWAVTLSLIGGIGGALVGLFYGSLDDGTRIWRYPVTQAIILGGAIGANVFTQTLTLKEFLRSRHEQKNSQERDYFHALKTIGVKRGRNSSMDD